MILSGVYFLAVDIKKAYMSNAAEISCNTLSLEGNILWQSEKTQFVLTQVSAITHSYYEDENILCHKNLWYLWTIFSIWGCELLLFFIIIFLKL